MKYQFCNGSKIRRNLNAQVVGEELEAIRKRNGGRLTPEGTVRAAEPVDSTLHGAFEWNDKKAAVEYRLDQARYIIRSVVIVRNDELQAPTVRAFVQVTQGEDDRRTYTHIAVAMADKEMRAEVVDRARAELSSWRRRYHEIEKFSSKFEPIARAVDDLFAAAADATGAANNTSETARADNGKANDKADGKARRPGKRHADHDQRAASQNRVAPT